MVADRWPTQCAQSLNDGRVDPLFVCFVRRVFVRVEHVPHSTVFNRTIFGVPLAGFKSFNGLTSFALCERAKHRLIRVHIVL